MALLRLTLRNIRSRWIRFMLTALSVVLGVAFVVGVFIVTDGLRARFTDLAADISTGADLFLQPQLDFGQDLLGAPIDPEVPAQIEEIDGVSFAEGVIFRPGVSVLGPDGDSLGEGFRAGQSWAPRTTTYLVDGQAPVGPDEFALNAIAVREFDLIVGDRYKVEAFGGVRDMTLAGAFNFASPDEDRTAAGSFLSVDLPTAIDFFTGGAGLNTVAIALEPGADAASVSDQIGAVVGDGFEVISAEQNTENTQEDFDEFLDIFSNILLAFAIVTVVVSAFIIYNTFSIVIGQRVRELGLLKAMGAGSGQLTRTLVGEAIIVGIVATAIGFVAGLGIAAALRALFDVLEVGFPTGPLPIKTRTVIWAVAVGVGITTVSALIPALRARRVSAMAAIREELTLATGTIKLRPRLGIGLMVVGTLVLVAGVASGEGIIGLGVLAIPLLYFGGSRTRPFLGRMSILVVGVVLLAVAAFGNLSTAGLLGALAVGALATFVGVNLISPLFAPGLVQIIGTKPLGIALAGLGVLIPAGIAFGLIRAVADGNGGGALGMVLLGALVIPAAVLCWRTFLAPFGVEGRIGTRNAGRTPRRTSSTAAALMIGLALVGTVTVIAASLKSTLSQLLNDSVTADWFICLDDCTSFFDGFSPAMSAELATLPEVDIVIPYRFAPEAFRTPNGSVHDILTADFEHLADHFDADFVEGSPTGAGDRDILVHSDSAGEQDLTVGTSIEIEFASGLTDTFNVAGVYDDSRILGNWVITNDAYSEFLPPTEDQFVSLTVATGVSEEGARAAITEVTDQYPNVEARTKDEFRESQEGVVDQTLVIINVFLALALIIALVGIANTLALSVFERTREIGLLRAVGSTRAQTSMLVRWEGAIIAVFGGILGLGLGVVFGVIATIVIPDTIVSTITIPPLQLLFYLLLSALAGLIAGWLPARRAARLNVLDAISHE